MSRPARHIQAVVEYDGAQIEVDAGMAPLMTALWARGFRTRGSCEAFRAGTARIWFCSDEDRERFQRLEPRSRYLDGHCVDFPSEHIPALIAALDSTESIPAAPPA